MHERGERAGRPGVRDVFKGFVAAEWIPLLAGTNLSIPFAALQLLCGIAAIVGHIWTVFAGFRGGKGVGTAAGMLLALHPLAVLICFAIFLVVLFATRIVSISSISGAVAFPLLLTWFRYLGKPVADSLYYFSFFAAALIIFTHRSNIRRLLNGTENKFGKKK